MAGVSLTLHHRVPTSCSACHWGKKGGRVRGAHASVQMATFWQRGLCEQHLHAGDTGETKGVGRKVTP